MPEFLSRFARDESGATAIEYGLIAGFIAVVVVAGIGAIGTSLTAIFTTVASLFPA